MLIEMKRLCLPALSLDTTNKRGGGNAGERF